MPQPQKRARKEVYGFVGWAMSWIALLAYVIWAFVPDSILHDFGIYYFPKKYWAYTTPIYLFLCWVFSIVVYAAHNLISTAPVESLYTVTDEQAKDEGESLSLEKTDQIVPIADVPISVVTELLYHKKPAKVEGENPLQFSRGVSRSDRHSKGHPLRFARKHMRINTS
eukprot:TRINITY_DN6223_c0_g1_i1.p1 TRINITY_DN6223_c0_g1~~TRINITY_DN6223_c0_g1_i1.p1  ORF type:complete len:177 (+),score=29.73 TRINITY_DN6223_c0_g1_i1:30-533(+)